MPHPTASMSNGKYGDRVARIGLPSAERVNDLGQPREAPCVEHGNGNDRGGRDVGDHGRCEVLSGRVRIAPLGPAGPDESDLRIGRRINLPLEVVHDRPGPGALQGCRDCEQVTV